MSVLPNAGTHFPSHGSKIRKLTSYDMSLGMQWMALTCRATFSGPYGLRIIPFGALMPGKEIGFNWTNVVSLPRLELSTSSMPSALAHNDPFCGGKGVHHFIAIMQHCKVLVPFLCHQEFALDPVHHLSYVSTGMNISQKMGRNPPLVHCSPSR